MGGGFGVSGIARDLSGRLYMAATDAQTVLLAGSPEEEPVVYARTANRSGLRDGSRLESLFNGPSFLALDQSSGSVYVSDRFNHVIREVGPGPGGKVTTLAGTGILGGRDGSGTLAQFNRPAGLALETMRDHFGLQTNRITSSGDSTGRPERS